MTGSVSNVQSATRLLRRAWKTTQAFMAGVIYGFPGRKLRVVGVTGTDGKTTTVHLIVKALEAAGYTVGALSTIQYRVGTRVWANASKLTTPGPWELAKLLAHMVRAGCHYVVLECSSHRLDQNGFWGIPIDVAVITNITREHFDYHRDFADYTKAKARLFRALQHRPKQLSRRENIDPGGRIPTVAVVNLDDERLKQMLKYPAELKYGFTVEAAGSGQQATGFRTPDSGLRIPESELPEVRVVSAWAVNEDRTSEREPRMYCVRAGEFEALLPLKLPGKFNLQNALAAIAVGVSQGIELAQITRALAEVERVPGRMDQVQVGQPFKIIIDYAVTPAAFAALYGEAEKLKQKPARIIHVFGAAGGRDRGKRPLLGAFAAQRADIIILTDEDPFDEDPERILDEIESGVRREIGSRQPDSGLLCLRIRDRRLAIREALQRAQPGDVVLVTGKGAEETMAVRSQRIPWNDRKIIEEEWTALR